MILALSLGVLSACSSPTPALPPSAEKVVDEKIKEVGERLVGDQVNDLSGIPVSLTAAVDGVVGGAPAGAVTTKATATGDLIQVVVADAPVCDAAGIVATAARQAQGIHVSVSGGTPCAEGQAGVLTLHVTDRPGNQRGQEVDVAFVSANLTSPSAPIGR